MTEEKNVLKDEELDLVAGGLSWTCEHTGIGTTAERISFVAVSGPDESDYIKREIHHLGIVDAKDFIKEHAGDTFLTADGKPFKFWLTTSYNTIYQADAL